MVDADDVEQARGRRDAALPPVEAVVAHPVPVVKRVAPELTVGGEAVGRAACHTRRHTVAVELEQVGIRPDVARIVGNVDGQVADDLDAEKPGTNLRTGTMSEATNM